MTPRPVTWLMRGMFFAAWSRMRSSVLVLTVMLLLFSNCAGNPMPSRQLDDAVVASRVIDALRSDVSLGRYDLGVDARGGTVTLRGTVSSGEEKAKATLIAQSISGVASVVNAMSIR